MTIQNAPPGLDYDRDKRFSKVQFSFFLDYICFYLLSWSGTSTVICALFLFSYMKNTLIRRFPVVISPLKKWLLCAW